MGGVGVWKIGLDDLGIWPLTTRGLSGDTDLDAIKTVPTHDPPILRGRSELSRVRSSRSGARQILQTGQYINYAEYRELPEPSTIANLVAPFVDPFMYALWGNVQVGNVVHFLTAIQDVEYVTCQNYDRRPFDALNCIALCPVPPERGDAMSSSMPGAIHTTP